MKNKKYKLIFHDGVKEIIDVKLLEKVINKFIPNIVNKENYTKLRILFLSKNYKRCRKTIEGTFHVRMADEINSEITIFTHHILKNLEKYPKLDITDWVIQVFLHEIGHYVSFSEKFINRKNKKLNAFDFHNQVFIAELVEVGEKLYKKSKKEYRKWYSNYQEEILADNFVEENIELFIDIYNNLIINKVMSKI